ncbi:MAG: spore germination protein [Alicyclobacillus sp.]|nr:spore germination protein [Alicyclobacillus sp.]
MRYTTTLSGVQVILLTASSFLPLTYFFFPRSAIQAAGTDSLWSLVLLLLVGLAIAWLHGDINERFAESPGTDVPVALYGRWWGKLMAGLYLPLYILFVSLVLTFFAQIMRQFLPNTPNAAIIMAMSLSSLVGAWYGVEALGRVATVIYPLTFFGIFTTLLFVWMRYPTLPMTYLPTSPKAIASGVYHLLPIYFGLSLVLMLSPYYRHEPGKTHWYPVLSMGLNGVLMVLNFLVTLSLLGYEATMRLTFTLPFVIKLLELSGFLIERVGVSAMILATTFTLVFISNHMWALSTHTARLCNLSDDAYNRFVPVIAVAITAVALAIPSEEAGFWLLDHVLVPASWPLLLGIPFINWWLARRHGKQRRATSGKRNQE